MHNIDEQTSAIYDLKSGSTDYNEGLFPEVTVDTSKLAKGRSYGDYLAKDEGKAKDEGYRIMEVAKDVVQEAYPVEGVNLYSETDVIFIEPCFILDLKNNVCLTLRLSLKKYIAGAIDSGRVLLSMVNRARNKPSLLRSLKEQLVGCSLPLIAVSRLFDRVTGVYKQASIERQSVQRKTDRPTPLIAGAPVLQDREVETLVQQLRRASRLLPSTSMTGTALNQYLVEYTPSNRVLTGEVIVFQNEVIEIFKEMIASTQPDKAKPGQAKYVSAVIIDYLRALLEHGIPQQAVLQTMLLKYIVDHKDH